MATYQPLRLSAEPRVVTFSRWLLYDTAVARPVRLLRRSPGAGFLQDGQTAILILPERALYLPEVQAAYFGLLDELTIWRLSTADGTRMAVGGCAPSVQAQTARYRAGVRVPVAS